MLPPKNASGMPVVPKNLDNRDLELFLQNVRQVLNSIIIKRNGFVMNTRLLLGALATAAVLASPAHAKLDGKVPEPGTLTLLGAALLSVFGLQCRARR